MVRCPNGQVTVCKTVQGGSTPPRTSIGNSLSGFPILFYTPSNDDQK